MQIRLGPLEGRIDPGTAPAALVGLAVLNAFIVALPPACSMLAEEGGRYNMLPFKNRAALRVLAGPITACGWVNAPTRGGGLIGVGDPSAAAIEVRACVRIDRVTRNLLGRIKAA